MRHVATLTIHHGKEGAFVATFADNMKHETTSDNFTAFNSARVWLVQLAAREYATQRGYRVYGGMEHGTYTALVYIT